LVTREKRKKKKQLKETETSYRKPNIGKEQDHLKEERLGPLRQGQRLDTTESKTASRKEHKPPKYIRAPPAHMHTSPEHVPALATNRSG
jgi:hypothetical protein